MSFFFLVFDHSKEWRLADTTISQGTTHYAITDRAGALQLRLQRRLAYPGTYAQMSSSGIFFGYGNRQQADGEEFLTCSLTPSGKLTIQRDAFGTLPIYYAHLLDALYISNDYAELVARLPDPKISRTAFAQGISDEAPMATTFTEGVHVLWPDEVLLYQAGKLEVRQTKSRAWSLSSEAPRQKPRDFRKVFDDYLDYFVDSRLSGQRVAFEVSGGLDSGTLPQYLHRRGNDQLTMVGLLLPGEQKEYQHHKLSKFGQAVKSDVRLHQLDIRRDFPLQRMIAKNTIWPTYFEKTYFEPTEAYVKKLAAQGMDIICTGSGGDELFGNVVIPDPSGFRLSRSVRYSRLCNNIYIEHGLWPISPFVEPDLYTWVQGLPVQQRANKNILRAYHQANHFIPEVYNPKHNEEFTSFFTACFTSGVYDKFIEKLAKNSYGASAGVIDLQLLLDNYRQARTQTYPELDKDCFRIYLWMLAEINAQSLSGGASGDRLFG